MHPDNSLEQHLFFQLESFRPSSIIFLSRQLPSSALQKWADMSTCNITALDHQQSFPNDLKRHDFAILIDYLDHLEKHTGLQRLGQLRNLYSHRIWVANTMTSTYEFNDFIGLGFQRLTEKTTPHQKKKPLNSPSSTDINYYGYDLANYNHQRSWNNPKYWANPENWHKYRW
ncbi:MAG: DUF6231 family protein [Cellvibrionaceae bacterium]